MLFFIMDNVMIGVTNEYRELNSPTGLEYWKTTLSASASWDPGSIDDGDEEAKEVTVTGAALGDYAIASFSVDVEDLALDAQVSTGGTVTCVLSNNTGSAVDLGSGTVYVKVLRK